MSSTTVNTLRYCNVLPSAKLAQLSSEDYTGISINDLEAFSNEPVWWKREQYLDIHFNEQVEDDITSSYSELCSPCRGECCKKQPDHNIGMYMSPYEIKKAESRGFEDFLQGTIGIEGYEFGVIKSKPNGTCHFLTDKGCKLGDDRPLWCKLWVCDKLQDDRSD